VVDVSLLSRRWVGRRRRRDLAIRARYWLSRRSVAERALRPSAAVVGVEQSRHEQRTAQAPAAAAVVVAPQTFDVESSRRVNRDRAGVVDPHFQFELVCPAARACSKRASRKARPPPRPRASGRIPIPRYRTPGACWRTSAFSDNAAGVLEHPGRRWRLGFDQFSEPPALSLEIDGVGAPGGSCRSGPDSPATRPSTAS
jgi:hypothetical protein